MTQSNQIIDKNGETSLAASNITGLKQFTDAWAKTCTAAARSASFSLNGGTIVDTSAYHAVSEMPADRQLRRLYRMKNVEPGWAGPGSCPPVKEAVDATVELIKRLRNLPFPIPMASVGADGRTGLFWSDEKLYADIEILEDGKVGYLIEVKGRPQVDNEEDMPDVGLPEGVAWALASAYLNNRK